MDRSSHGGQRLKHPAKFTDVLLDTIADVFKYDPDPVRILDPFAGTGRVHLLAERSTMLETIGVEIEPEWSRLHPRTIVGNALALPFGDGAFDAIVTSPCYGNRMADHHNARDASKRITYTHVLGRKLHPHNSGTLQWGERYREFHRQAWAEAVRVLRPGGRFILNISDHVRAGKVQRVTAWHVADLLGRGLDIVDVATIPTPRMRRGANSHLRVDHETVAVFRRAA